MEGYRVRRPLRILHVIAVMNPGGAEMWLMNILRHIDRKRYKIDFLVLRNERGEYDDEIHALGSRVIYGDSPKNMFQYIRTIMSGIRKHGPYDIVHSHLHHFSGVVLKLSRLCGVPVRIAHSHSDIRVREQNAPIGRRIYLHLMKGLIEKNATDGLACSTSAGESLFGKTWTTDSRWQTLFCGINVNEFVAPLAADDNIRTTLGIPGDAPVFGHVGNFRTPKNHDFFVDIAEQIVSRLPGSRFLLIGDGPLKAQIQAKVEQKGLEGNFIFAGSRNDVPALMRKAMDVLIFPSLYEGLPLTIIEAQAAGLPCVISPSVPEDAEIVGDLQRVSLSEASTVWAEIAIKCWQQVGQIDPGASLEAVKASMFNIDNSVVALQNVYARSASYRL